jgi:hypothetical protein
VTTPAQLQDYIKKNESLQSDCLKQLAQTSDTNELLRLSAELNTINTRIMTATLNYLTLNLDQKIVEVNRRLSAIDGSINTLAF